MAGPRRRFPRPTPPLSFSSILPPFSLQKNGENKEWRKGVTPLRPHLVSITYACFHFVRCFPFSSLPSILASSPSPLQPSALRGARWKSLPDLQMHGEVSPSLPLKGDVGHFKPTFPRQSLSCCGGRRWNLWGGKWWPSPNQLRLKMLLH